MNTSTPSLLRFFCLSLIFSLLFLPGKTFAQTINIPAGSGPTISNILGGQLTDISDAPYQISIEGSSGNHYCGGSIIADRWILTAAHCLQGQSTSNVYVHAGSTDQTNNSVGQVIQAQTLHIHPGYNASTLENDVALIYLSQALQFNHNVMPITIADSCNTDTAEVNGSAGISAFLTGWGITCNSCPVAIDLQGATMPLISQSSAMATNISYNASYTNNISNNMIAFYDPGTGAGPGDSGGPAVLDNNGNLINLGASSWGYWPKDQVPTVYANIRNYAGWINGISGVPLSSSTLDLYMKDRPWDMGAEASGVWPSWVSEDIWVRKTNDGLPGHQNPEYYALAGNYNYVYVRVRNKSCVTSNGNEVLKLYWAKAATALSWPNHWNGTMTSGGHPLGDEIGQVTLPPIEPGDAYIASFQWQPPNPNNYVGLYGTDPVFFAEEPHHFCLLARMESSVDVMTFPETSDLSSNVLNNNNIVWKNLTVVDSNVNNIAPGGWNIGGGTIMIGDAWADVDRTFHIEFRNPDFYEGTPITAEAEVLVTLASDTWDKWAEAGYAGQNVRIHDADQRQLIITESPARMENLEFSDMERTAIHVGFNFNGEKQDQLIGRSFEYEVVQLRRSDGRVMGGEQYRVNIIAPPEFYADAGPDVSINQGESATLTAVDMGDQVRYYWFNPAGDLVGTDISIQVSPEETSIYRLQIRSDDGNEDTDEVTVSVKTQWISSLAPNPADERVTVYYNAGEASSATLVLIPVSGADSQEYPVDPADSEYSIDVSDFKPGVYEVLLICDGDEADNSTLVVQ